MVVQLTSYTKGIEYNEKTCIRDNLFQDSVGNTMVNPNVSGGWPQSKSMKKFQDQLLYASQVGTESSSALALHLKEHH
jgi:cell division septal protein FtsQ